MPRIDPGLRRDDEEEASCVGKEMEPVAAGTVELVPELEVSDFGKSLEFYVGILGFSVLYDRPERPFAYLGLGAAHIMIEKGGAWITAPLEKPFGRGMNFQISVPNVSALAARLTQVGWPLFRKIEDAWYRRGAEYIGARELVVQDPDGYLLRFSQSLGISGSPVR
jgi:catechol 2,3-dioxygenase-like lactoylglutathione lyase family enzyme